MTVLVYRIRARQQKKRPLYFPDSVLDPGAIGMHRHTLTRRLASVLLLLFLPGGAMAHEQGQSDVTYDNLVPVEGGRMQSSFMDPEADILVAFLDAHYHEKAE